MIKGVVLLEAKMGSILTQPTSSPIEQVPSTCLFCALVSERNREIVVENGSFLAVFDNFPVNQGHTLVISKRHISTPFEMLSSEGIDLIDLFRVAKVRLDNRFHPDGYNVGINSGIAAGQTVPHLHIHLIPRYRGDVENPRGGIRNFKQPLVTY